MFIRWPHMHASYKLADMKCTVYSSLGFCFAYQRRETTPYVAICNLLLFSVGSLGF